ncbi:unnamed protein product [Sphacelaria rigidula]
MGTLSFPGLEAAQIESASGLLTINEAAFPTTDSTFRATASFGSSEPFTARSKRQEVTTSTAVVGIGISIVGVNFDGPVSLTFADSSVDVKDLHIVDEGGFCSPDKKITTITDVGNVEISNPYSSMRVRVLNGVSIPEAVAPVINEDGSQTTENPDGSTTEVDAEGNSTTTLSEGGTTTTQQVLADGTTIDTQVQDNGNMTSYTVLPDGTTIDVVESNNGNMTSYTEYPDGSTVALEESNNGNVTSFTTLADGTTIDVVESNNGNSSQVTVSPEGNVETVSSMSNGSINNSTVNADGSSYSYERKTNGKIFITTVDVNGTEVREEYVPWQSYYTVTTTPPGTSETFSPNPYAT